MKKIDFFLATMAMMVCLIILVGCGAAYVSDDGGVVRPPQFVWSKVFKSSSESGYSWESAKSVISTTDGGFIVAVDHEAVTILKLNSLGEKEWELGGFTREGGSGPISVAQGEDGNIYVLAEHHYYNASMSVGTGIWLTKINSEGSVMWQHMYVDAAGSKFSPQNFHLTSDGGFILIGSIEENNFADIFAVKLNEDGSVEWQNRLNIDQSYLDWGMDIRETEYGYILVGKIVVYEGNDYSVVIWLSSDGELVRSESLNGYNIRANAMTVDGDKILLAGSMDANSTSSYKWNLLLLELSLETGEVLFKSKYQIGDSDRSYAYSIASTDDGYILSGGAGWNVLSGGNYDGLLMKVDKIGDVQWARTYDFSTYDEFYGLDVSLAGIVAAGIVYEFNKDYDVLVVKLNDFGETEAGSIAEDIVSSPGDLITGSPVVNQDWGITLFQFEGNGEFFFEDKLLE